MANFTAYCGINCAGCDAYKATLNDDKALREKIAGEWTKAHNFAFTPEMINCVSCKADGVHVGYCLECGVRACASEKGVETCGFCDEFDSCKTINGFLDQAPELRENLKRK